MTKNAPETIDAYISSFPKEVQKHLNDIRATIRKAAPKAEEAIKYAMPTFIYHGNLVHFAAYKNHIGFYPAPQGLQAFKEELSKYEGSKGAVRFPIDGKMPLTLIAKITKYRVKKNEEVLAIKRPAKKKAVAKKAAKRTAAKKKV